MRIRNRSAWLCGLGALLLGAGCAASGSKPCMIIPAQIELARDVRDEAQGSLEEKQADFARTKSNVEQTKLHMARLVEERDQLRKEVGGSPTDTEKSEGQQNQAAPPPVNERKTK
jgi:hypothetical protein